MVSAKEKFVEHAGRYVTARALKKDGVHSSEGEKRQKAREFVKDIAVDRGLSHVDFEDTVQVNTYLDGASSEGYDRAKHVFDHELSLGVKKIV